MHFLSTDISPTSTSTATTTTAAAAAAPSAAAVAATSPARASRQPGSASEWVAAQILRDIATQHQLVDAFQHLHPSRRASTVSSTPSLPD